MDSQPASPIRARVVSLPPEAASPQWECWLTSGLYEDYCLLRSQHHLAPLTTSRILASRIHYPKSQLVVQMHILTAFFTFAVLATAALANKCNHDNCYRALAHYQANDTCFCNEYLATP